MGRKKITLRSIALLVIFVMLVICSLLSFSYAYYASTANNNNAFSVHNTVVECLSITTSTSTYKIATSLPSYFYPVSDSSAMTGDGIVLPYVGYDYSGQSFGQAAFNIKNNCGAAVNFDIIFIPDALNEMNFSYIRYSICNDHSTSYQNPLNSCFAPRGSTKYSTARNLSAYCYWADDSGFWSYMASTAIGGLAKGGADGRMCSFVRGDYPNGYSIAANSSTVLAFRFWIDSSTATSNYNGKRMSGKFVVYTF